MFDGEFGHELVRHSLPKDKHKANKNHRVIKDYADSLKSAFGHSDKIMTKDESKRLAFTLSSHDPNMTTAQIITKIRSMFPNAQMPTRKQLHATVSQVRAIKLNSKGTVDMIDAKAIKTLRKTQFGRDLSFSLINDKPKYFLYLFSDFQKSVADEVRNDPY